jgi:hypothetical protein
MKLSFTLVIVLSGLMVLGCSEKVDGILGPPPDDNGNGNGNGDFSVIGLWDYQYTTTALDTGGACKDTTYTMEIEIDEEPWADTSDTNCTYDWNDKEYHTECVFNSLYGECSVTLTYTIDGELTKDTIRAVQDMTTEFSGNGCDLYKSYFCTHSKTEIVGVRKD